MPSARPDTTPVADPMPTFVVLLLVHVPPVGVLLSVLANPRHADREPLIVDGNGFTLMLVVVRQPVDNV